MPRAKHQAGTRQWTNCIRCDVVLKIEDAYKVAELDYCKHCHGDLFVSWKEAYDRLPKR